MRKANYIQEESEQWTRKKMKTEQNQVNAIKEYIIVGNSGSGKSSFINCISRVTLAPEGKISSITQKARIYEIYNQVLGKIKLLDTPGFGDTKKDDYDILLNFIKPYLKNDKSLRDTFDGIIFIQPLQLDRDYAQKQANLLSETFGVQLDENNYIVVSSKFNDNSDKKKQQIKKENEKQINLLTTILWDSKEQVDDQETNLKQGLSRLKPFKILSIVKLKQNIIEEQQRLYEQSKVDVAYLKDGQNERKATEEEQTKAQIVVVKNDSKQIQDIIKLTDNNVSLNTKYKKYIQLNLPKNVKEESIILDNFEFSKKEYNAHHGQLKHKLNRAARQVDLKIYCGFDNNWCWWPYVEYTIKFKVFFQAVTYSDLKGKFIIKQETQYTLEYFKKQAIKNCLTNLQAKIKSNMQQKSTQK